MIPSTILNPLYLLQDFYINPPGQAPSPSQQKPQLKTSSLSSSSLILALNPSMATEMMSMSQKNTETRGYVTFLAGNGDYVKGVVGLDKGLRKAKSRYPLVVAVLPDVPEEHRQILVAQGCLVRLIQPVYPPQNQTQFAVAYYVINYSKLRIWEVIFGTSPIEYAYYVFFG